MTSEFLAPTHEFFGTRTWVAALAERGVGCGFYYVVAWPAAGMFVVGSGPLTAVAEVPVAMHVIRP